MALQPSTRLQLGSMSAKVSSRNEASMAAGPFFRDVLAAGVDDHAELGELDDADGMGLVRLIRYRHPVQVLQEALAVEQSGHRIVHGLLHHALIGVVELGLLR